MSAETKPYRPSNGCEGADFMDRFCGRCKRDAKFRETANGEDGCPIAANALTYDVDDPKYPPEWVAEDGFRNPRCTAFEAEGAERCDRTADMFGGGGSAG